MSGRSNISVNLAVSLRPWHSPNYAVPAGNGAQGVAVGELPLSALDALARSWLDELYEKAGHKNPWKLTG